MHPHIPLEKCSKKKRRELAAQRRSTWSRNPVTRKPPNPRAYNRKKAQHRKEESYPAAPFVFL